MPLTFIQTNDGAYDRITGIQWFHLLQLLAPAH